MALQCDVLCVYCAFGKGRAEMSKPEVTVETHESFSVSAGYSQVREGRREGYVIFYIEGD